MNNEKGSATLEAAIILPVIMLLLFSMLSLGLFLYQRFVILNSALYAVEQSSMTWNNSLRDPETGLIEPGDKSEYQTDGLYWRIIQDFPDAPLVSQKKAKALSLFEKAAGRPVFTKLAKKNRLDYSNYIFSRRIVLDTENKFLVRDILVSKAAGQARASVQSEVVEPQEFIRNYELGSTYLSQFMNYIDAQGRQDTQEEEALTVYASKNSDVNGQKLYHFSGCRYINQIKKENLLVFGSEKEAQEAGFHLCLICAKAKKGQTGTNP